mmetsp:Transcript_21284/g.29792  ORF Transcript_21284/g.29792 Transcript_21284/m.29792 type:complete len:83 (+) Transcript_21284:277-525(+)
MEKKGCFSIDDLIRKRDYIGSKDFLVKTFFCDCGGLPYYSLFPECYTRTLLPSFQQLLKELEEAVATLKEEVAPRRDPKLEA